MGGRRAHYTTRIAKRLCEHIALGATLKTALDKEPCGPSLYVFWRWLDEYPEFREMYERARALQADLMADTIMTMAEEVLNKPKFAPAYKVASDILRWQAEVRNPSRYGNKVQIAHVTPLDPTKLRTEIKQLEKELGLIAQEDPNILDVEVTTVPTKALSE